MNHFLITEITDKSVNEVMQALEALLKEKGVNIFARIDHAKAAEAAGLSMPAEQVLIFGNPAVGTALMLENPAIGIELPLKILAWQQGEKTKIAYQDMDRLKEIFNIDKTQQTLNSLKSLLQQLIKAVL